MSTGQGDDTAEIEQLREEVSKLQQSLHEVQERERLAVMTCLVNHVMTV